MCAINVIIGLADKKTERGLLCVESRNPLWEEKKHYTPVFEKPGAKTRNNISQINEFSRRAPLFLIWFGFFQKKKKSLLLPPTTPLQPFLTSPTLVLLRHKFPGTQNWEFINYFPDWCRKNPCWWARASGRSYSYLNHIHGGCVYMKWFLGAPMFGDSPQITLFKNGAVQPVFWPVVLQPVSAPVIVQPLFAR